MPGLAYAVTASADAVDLRVEVDVPRGLGAMFTIDPDAVPFVDDVAVAVANASPPRTVGWAPVPQTRTGWRAPGCSPAGCRLRYRFHLRAAAQALDDPDTAAVRGGALVAPASTWLLRPSDIPGGAELQAQLRVAVPRPSVFVSGLARAGNAENTYSVALLPSFVSPYSAFGRFSVERLEAGGAELELAVAAPELAPDVPRVRAWVTAAARAVSTYFGRFPVPRALVVAVPQASGLHGKAMGGGGATVLLQMAPGADLADPAFDWQAAHEMVHLAVPEMPRAHTWLSEGLATYLEPIARTMTGELAPETVWRDLVVGLPKGLPAPGDRGLDHTHTWGRTYWGGALFAFVADVEIRKATHGAQSLQTAMRGVLAAGGDARVSWPVERFLVAADGALEKPILGALYRQMAEHPVAVDLPRLWRELGVRLDRGRVELDDRAPLASIRRRMLGAP